MAEEKFGYGDFLSPFTWRYGTPEMRRIFSEISYRTFWRKIWVALAEAQSKYGLVSRKELADLKSKANLESIDIPRAHEIEAEIRHDLMAEIRTYAEQCPVGGGKIHLGATSMDIEDNADALRIKAGLNILLTRLVNTLNSLTRQVTKYKGMACMGWTHIQPAEPTTVGYRFAGYAQDIVSDIKAVEYLLKNVVRGKGIKGAVGTSASFQRLLKGKGKPEDMEADVMRKLGLDSYLVATQTYPRKLDYAVLSVLASIAQSAHKFALDLRHLQSPTLGEMSEPMKGAQVGSSAMPFKRNPITSERICSLSRYVAALPGVAWGNASETILERTLDDSANRRIIIPDGFLATDECLVLYNHIVSGVRVYPVPVRNNLERYGPFAGTEAIMMRLVERGEDRQQMHERIRLIAAKSWGKVFAGKENPLPKLLKADRVVRSRLSAREVAELLKPAGHVGDAKRRCERFAREVARPVLARHRRRIGRKPEVKF